jgi:hypothetical protein
MTTEPISTDTAAAKWAETFARMERAEAIYQEVKAASQPLYDLEAAFEARHGLTAPGVSRNATPNYFEKRAALFEVHPHYKAPEAIADTLEALTEVVCAIETDLMQLPAPDLKALHWKLARTAGACWSDEYVAQMRIDMDALLLVEA